MLGIFKQDLEHVTYIMVIKLREYDIPGTPRKVTCNNNEKTSDISM